MAARSVTWNLCSLGLQDECAVSHDMLPHCHFNVPATSVNFARRVKMFAAFRLKVRLMAVKIFIKSNNVCYNQDEKWDENAVTELEINQCEKPHSARSENIQFVRRFRASSDPSLKY